MLESLVLNAYVLKCALRNSKSFLLIGLRQKKHFGEKQSSKTYN